MCDFDAARGCYKVFVLNEARLIALPPASVLYNGFLVVSYQTIPKQSLCLGLGVPNKKVVLL